MHIITLLMIALFILILTLLLLSVRLFFRKEVAIESSCGSTGKFSDTKKKEHNISLFTETCNGESMCCKTM